MMDIKCNQCRGNRKVATRGFFGSKDVVCGYCKGSGLYMDINSTLNQFVNEIKWLNDRVRKLEANNETSPIPGMLK